MVKTAYRWYAFRRKHIRLRPSKRGVQTALNQAQDERSFCRRVVRKSLSLCRWSLKPLNWLHLLAKASYRLVARLWGLLKLVLRIMTKPLRLFF